MMMQILCLNRLTLEGMLLEDGIDKIIEQAGTKGFIKDGKRIVFVSAAISGKEVSEEYVSSLKNVLNEMQTNQSEINIMSTFIENSKIISEAKANKLSIGREFLYEYSKNKNIALTVDDIRDKTITDSY